MKIVMLIGLIACSIMTPLHIIGGNMSGAIWGIIGVISCFGVLMLDR